MRGGVVPALLTSIALGVAVGVAARAGHRIPDAYWIASLGGPWLAAAFAAGALAGRHRHLAALAGAATIVTGTLAYYSVVALYHGITYLHVPLQGARYGVAMAVGWSVAGLAVGAAFGAAGALWRRGRASLWGAAGGAALAGALVGEALLLQAAWESPWAQRVLAAELVAGLLVALVLARGHRAAALAFTLPFAAVFFVAENLVRDTLRAAGWAGA